MSKRPRGLGRGLDALLGGETDLDTLRRPIGYVNKEVVTKDDEGSGPNTADILRIPIDMIEPNPFQPRMSFDQESLQELADSIKSFGLIQPITVRKRGAGRYQIISGERRFRACKLVGLDMIPAYIRDTDDQGMLEMAIVENIQREDLDPIEIALSYQRLIEECHLTQEQMALRVGKKRSSVTNSLRLLQLPAKIQHDLKVGLISVGHAKVLLGVEETELQEHLCDLVIREGLSVRQLEKKIKSLTTQKPQQQDGEQDLPEEYIKVLEIVGRYFQNNISLKRSSTGRGTMTIHFSNDNEVREFLKALEDSKF